MDVLLLMSFCSFAHVVQCNKSVAIVPHALTGFLLEDCHGRGGFDSSYSFADVEEVGVEVSCDYLGNILSILIWIWMINTFLKAHDVGVDLVEEIVDG